MSYTARDRAGSFGEDPWQYDRSRPRYPDALLDDLVHGNRLDVVDVGCGTGIVARQLADRGCAVIGVEADERMATVARSNGVEVEVSAFEEWDSRGRQFDLLTSGQAWHWIRPDAGVTKAAEVLRSGGRFSVFWNVPSHDPEAMAAFEPIYTRLAPHILHDSVALGTVTPPPGNRDPDANALKRSGRFENIERREYSWARQYSRDEWLDELPTHSNHRLLDPTVLADLLREVGDAITALGGVLSTDYTTGVLFATRVGD